MRKQIEQHKLESLAIQSMNSEELVEWKNSLGEIFIFENGELTQYTDTRVIHHEDDGLINLRTDPLQFDNDLPDMDWVGNA